MAGIRFEIRVCSVMLSPNFVSGQFLQFQTAKIRIVNHNEIKLSSYLFLGKKERIDVRYLVSQNFVNDVRGTQAPT